MSEKPTVHDMMVAYAQDAVDHAKANFGKTLDYSDASIEIVESILDSMSKALPQGLFAKLFKRGPSEKVLATFAKMYGGYIGEVLRLTAGGEWVVDEEIVPGQPTIALSKNNDRLYPVAKVYHRFVNGAEDNVLVFVKVLRKEGWSPAA